MPSPAASLRLAPLATLSATILALTGCGSQGTDEVDGQSTATAAARAAEPQKAPEGVEPPSATLKGVDAAPGMEAPGTESPSDQVEGLWKVIDAAGPASAKAMLGRTLSFDDTALGWLAKDGKVEPGCSSPIYHIVVEAIQVRSFAPAFKAGWPQFRLPPAAVGPMHVWECEGVEEIFGPQEPAAGSAFFPVAPDKLVMNWHDGAVLLLQRGRKPGA